MRQQDDIYFMPRIQKNEESLTLITFKLIYKQNTRKLWDTHQSDVTKLSPVSGADCWERSRLEMRKYITRDSLPSFVDSITLNEKHLKWTYLRMTQTFSCNKSMKMTTTFKETKPYPKMFARPTFWAGTCSSLQFYWWLATLKDLFVLFVVIFFSLFIFTWARMLGEGVLSFSREWDLTWVGVK